MYYVSKRMEIGVNPSYDSRYGKMYAHNWIITVYCRSDKLTDYGTIVNFTKIKNEIRNRLDHSCVNDVVYPINPTAESLAKWVCKRVSDICEVGTCYKVEIQENEGNTATYVED